MITDNLIVYENIETNGYKIKKTDAIQTDAYGYRRLGTRRPFLRLWVALVKSLGNLGRIVFSGASFSPESCSGQCYGSEIELPTLDDDTPPVSVQNFRERTTTHERHPFGRLRENFYIIT